MPKMSIEVSKEEQDFTKEFAASKGMTQAEAATYLYSTGVGRKQALLKYADKNPSKPKKARKTKAKSTKKATKKKATKKGAKKKSTKAKSKSSGKSGITDAELLEMKDSGKSNPQIAKDTGLSKDQVYRRIKRAQKAQKAA